MNQFVVGLEADMQAADIGRTNTIAFPGDGFFVATNNTARDHIDWFGTVRGRLGWVRDTALLYVTGGAAFGGVHTSVATNSIPADPLNTFTGAFGDTRFGWSGGAGIEWAFAPSWTIRGEYLHVDLGTDDVTMVSALAPLTATYRFHHQFDAVRVGVNYKFGGSAIANY